MRATEKDTSKWRGSWNKWLEEVLCNTTIASVDDFYKCVETLVYKREELIFRMQDFSFETTDLRNRDENQKYIIGIVSSSPTDFHSEKIGLIRVTNYPPVSIRVKSALEVT